MRCSAPRFLALCLLAACGGGGLPVSQVPPDGAVTGGKVDGPGGSATDAPSGNAADGPTGVVAPGCGGEGEVCCAGNSCNSGCCNFGKCIANGATCVPSTAICSAGACGTCGGAGQPCCGSQSCTASGTACIRNSCARCGGEAEPCCPPPLDTMLNFQGTCTKPTLVCDGDTAFCKSCGTAGGPCCADNTCGGGACCFGGTCLGSGQVCGMPTSMAGVCSGGRCSGCGGTGEPCCGSGFTATCTPGHACQESRCIRCGGDGERCCPTPQLPQACATGYTCSSDNVCGKCGGPGEPCCKGNTCTAGCCFAGKCSAPGSACNHQGKSYGTCVEGRCTCGGVGEPCCPGEVVGGVQDWTCLDLAATCAPPAGATGVRTCTRCGVVGASCCADKTCREMGTSCLSRPPEGFRCRKCGAPGDPCCTQPGSPEPFCDANVTPQEEPTGGCTCR